MRLPLLLQRGGGPSFPRTLMISLFQSVPSSYLPSQSELSGTDYCRNPTNSVVECMHAVLGKMRCCQLVIRSPQDNPLP
jgi:hypothetical protein